MTPGGRRGKEREIASTNRQKKRSSREGGGGGERIKGNRCTRKTF